MSRNVRFADKATQTSISHLSFEIIAIFGGRPLGRLKESCISLPVLSPAMIEEYGYV